MSNYAKVTVSAKTIDEGLATALEAAQAVVDKARADLIAAYKASPRGIGLAEVAKLGSYRSDKLKFSWDQYNNMVVSLEFAADPQQHVAQPYLDPKTANMLLSGKLLNDDEKRVVLKRLGLDFSAPAAS